MTKNFLLAGFTTLLLACTNNSKHNAAKNDSSNHAGHIKTSSNTQNQRKLNPITETMTRMMHDMHNAKPTGNNDIDFAVMMVEHHKGAVEMSKVEVDKGNNAELKAFTQKVIEDQTKEIEFMHVFISKAPKATSSNAQEFQKALNGSVMAMMDDNTIIYNDIDKDFAAQMIPHHQSAVDMAKAYLQFGKQPSMTTLCQNIISSQEKEINWLKEWLAKNGK